MLFHLPSLSVQRSILGIVPQKADKLSLFLSHELFIVTFLNNVSEDELLFIVSNLSAASYQADTVCCHSHEFFMIDM